MLPRIAQDLWCMVPLKGLSGSAFGVVVSGPPALPVQFVERLANAAGWAYYDTCLTSLLA